MQLRHFIERDASSTLPEFGLSNYEKRLCSYLTRVELKGKKERKVVVLLTSDLVNTLRLLVEKRKDCNNVLDVCSSKKSDIFQRT